MRRGAMCRSRVFAEMGHRGTPCRSIGTLTREIATRQSPETNTMMNQRVALPVLMAGLLGVLWGCTPPTPLAADKTQEVKIAQLERELKISQDASIKTG